MIPMMVQQRLKPEKLIYSDSIKHLLVRTCFEKRYKTEKENIKEKDKGYDSERLRQQIEVQGARPVIPRKRNSIKGNADLDRELYRYRHLVENAFARLKHYRAVAFRFDKLKRNYESVIAMACAFLWLPM